MEAAPDLEAALAAVRAVGSRLSIATDEQLLADGATIEAIGRLVDAHRLAFAAEAEQRTASPRGVVPFAFEHGFRDAVDLVAHVARVDRPTAKRRVGLGSALAPAVSLLGERLPGRFGVLAHAVAAGEVGVDSARVIVEKVLHLQRRIGEDDFANAVAFLTDEARVKESALVRDAADTLAAVLDPDGAEPNERNQHLQRVFRLGRMRADGMTPGRILLTPEHVAMVKELLESRRRNAPLIRTTAGGSETCDEPDPEWREGLAPEGDEPRSRGQQDYDTLIGAVEAGVRSEQSTAVTHEVVVHVSAADLESRRGQGWISGVLAGIPIPVIERYACSDGIRLLVSNEHGEALYLGRSRRLFSPGQRKVLIAKAGGRCEFPACTTPAPFLEAHHVAWFDRDGGTTDVSNGVMLCSHHHHLIHSKLGRIEIRRWSGDLWFVPTRWRDDPLPEHRRQPGPLVDPRIARAGPAPGPDPWGS